MKEKHKEELLTIISKYLPNAKVFLFGSRARNTHREGADIDLALDTGLKININTILDIKADIEETTIPLFVDIVDMQSITTDLKEEIEKDKVIWKD